MYSRTDINTLRRAMSNYSPTDLIAMLCISAIQCTTDMVADTINDPNELAANGIPTKKHIVGRSLDHIFEIMPEMVGDDDNLSDQAATEAKAMFPEMFEGNDAMRSIIAIMMVQLIKSEPTLIQLTLTPR